MTYAQKQMEEHGFVKYMMSTHRSQKSGFQSARSFIEEMQRKAKEEQLKTIGQQEQSGDQNYRSLQPILKRESQIFDRKGSLKEVSRVSIKEDSFLDQSAYQEVQEVIRTEPDL